MSSIVASDLVPTLRARSVAVGSGKGGVGKSTTALNVALLLSRQGCRTALVDLDPLSNVAVILDIPPEKLDGVLRDPEEHGSLERFVAPYGENIDLVFPHPGARDDGGVEKFRLFARFAEQLVERYDVLIFDLPAGISAEENLHFLPYIGALLLVTNAEPTSHVSAGGYLRSIFEIRSTMPILVWHNRYRPAGESGFDPRSVVANYNRYVGDELKITDAEAEAIRDIAFVPPDPALDLLQTDIDPSVTIYAKIRETLGLVLDQLIRSVVASVPAGKKSLDLIVYYLTHTSDIDEAELYVRELDAFLAGVIRTSARERVKELWDRLDRSGDLEVLSAAQETALRRVVAELASDELFNELVRVLRILDDAIEAVAGSSRGFLQRLSLDHHRIVRGAVPRVLSLIGAEAASHGGGRLSLFARNAAATTLFLIATDKEFDDDEARELIRRLIPTRRKARGGVQRDRYRQILRVLSRDEEYHRLFFQVVRTLFPSITRKISALNARFGLSALLLRDEAGAVHRSAYVKLTTHVVHDVVNAGLGVSISATYNAAAQSIRAGVDGIVRDRRWQRNEKT